MDEPIFVGRAGEFARLQAALADTGEGRGRCLFFVGEPGIGKTRLLRWVEQAAMERGFALGWGRCWEVGGAPAFWPWSQVFTDLGVPDPLAEAGGSTIEATHQRFHQFARARRALATLAEKRPLAILLDDLHAADVPSLSLLQMLASGPSSGRILVVGTYREAEAMRGEAAPVLAKIGRAGEVLRVGRLTVDEVVAWVTAVRPRTDPATARKIHAVTEGNPLFIHELLRVGSFDGPAVAYGLRSVLDEHLALVGGDARATLGAATVFGRETAVSDVAAITGETVDTIAGHFREACAAGVLEPSAELDRYMFSHVLLRDRLYGELSPSQRANLHWRAGERLAARGDVGSAAHHFLEGAGPERAIEAGRAARDAVALAMKGLAFEEAIRLATRALEAMEAAGAVRTDEGGTLGCELEIIRAEAKIRAGDATAGKQACLRAAALARQLGSPALEGRAALAYGVEIASGQVDPSMVRILRDALEVQPKRDDGASAQLMVRLATALTPPSAEAVVEVQRLSLDALDIARRLGDPDTLLYVSYFANWSCAYQLPFEDRVEMCREAAELASKLGRPLVSLAVGGFWVVTLRESGQLAASAAALAHYERLTRELPHPDHRWRLPMLRATGMMLEGRFDAAEELADATIAGAEGAPLCERSWAMHRVGLAMARGEPSSIAPYGERLLACFEPKPGFEPFTAWVLAALGRHGEARARLVNVKPEPWRYMMHMAAAEAAVLVGDRGLAEGFLPTHESRLSCSRIFWGGPPGVTAIGPLSRIAADLAALLGRVEHARRLYERAIDEARAMNAPALEALAQRGLDGLGSAAGSASAARVSTVPAPEDARISLVASGDTWTVTSFTERTVRLKDGKGVRYLERLLQCEGTEIHSMELAGMDEPDGSAGAILDARAKAEYRERLDDLQQVLEEATRFADAARAEKAQSEIDALAAQLAAAVGLGGRDREGGSLSQRARINVQRRIRAVIEQITQQDPALGRYLTLGLRTGVFCVFRRP